MPTPANEFDDFAEVLLVKQGVPPCLSWVLPRSTSYCLRYCEFFTCRSSRRGRMKMNCWKAMNPRYGRNAIKMCRRLGLIDETLYFSLERLRAIRNKCAHNVAFDHGVSPLRQYFSDFRKSLSGRESYRLTKKRYFDDEFANPIEEMQCLLLTICVLLEAVRTHTVQTKGNKKTLKVSAR